MSTKTITVDAKRYEDMDDCLAAALADVAEDQGVETWQCDADWGDEDRETITVTIRTRD